MDLDFDEVAASYAKGMRISIGAARKELASGRMPLAAGAKALKDAVNAKFGGINADKMLGLDNQLNKFKEDLAAMAKDVDLTPLLKGIKALADNFDMTSVNGKAMKGIITTIGNAIGITFKDGVPVMQNFIDKAVWGALKIENYWLRAKIAFRETFGTKTTLEFVAFKAVLNGVVATVVAMIPGLGLMIDGVNVLRGAWDGFSKTLTVAGDNIASLKDSILKIDWVSVGGFVIDGIVNGLDPLRLVSKVKGLATSIKKAFTGPDGIDSHSPSKVFEKYGKQIPAGTAIGIEAGAPGVQAAAAAMAPTPGAGSSGSGLAGVRGAVTITFSPTIMVNGGGDVRAQLKDPSLLQALTEAFIGQIRAAGIEVPA